MSAIECSDALNRIKSLMLAAPALTVAYSGGMDSSLLALLAQRFIPGKYRAVFVNSAFMSADEIAFARSTAVRFGLNMQEIWVDVLSDPLVVNNSSDRCYHCKKGIFLQIIAAGGNAAVCDGSVTDDDDDYRPGKRALMELGVRSPLKEAGISKAMAADLLESLGAGDLVRSAQSCLATRIVTGTAVNAEILRQIEAGEVLLRKAGLRSVRLRHHGEVARIEVHALELHRALDVISSLAAQLKATGFRHVCLDVDGYSRGSMNRR